MRTPMGFGPTGVRTMRWPGVARRCTGFTWIIEGDVKACFDEISHKAILRCLKEKVMDNKFLALIHRLLKAGVEIDGAVHPTTKGVPQGGVVSPLLANIVLNKLDWFLHSKGFHGAAEVRRWQHGLPNVRFSRYADDWCVFLTRATDSSGTATGRDPRLPSGNLRARTVCRKDPDYPREGRVRLLGFNISVGVGKSGEFSAQSQGRPQGNRQHPDSLGRSPSLLPNAGKHLGPS